jgi:hypothetical protein
MNMEQTECSETLAFKLPTSVNHPEESIRHSEHGESLKSRIIHLNGGGFQDTFEYSKNSGSRKANSSPPSLSFFVVEITTPHLVSYSSITTSTPKPPIQSMKATVLPYSGKGYIIKNFTPQLYFIPTRL